MQEDAKPVYTKLGSRVELDPKKSDVLDIKDIASRLSAYRRFGGEARTFFSLAEHCIAVSAMVPEKLAGQAFVLNFASAYLGDYFHEAPWNAKRIAFWIRVVKRFGVTANVSSDVWFADQLATATEMRELSRLPPECWKHLPKPISTKIYPMSQTSAQLNFLRKYEALKMEGLLT